MLENRIAIKIPFLEYKHGKFAEKIKRNKQNLVLDSLV